MSLIELARLSDAQQAELAAYGERWAALRGSTALGDRAAAEAGVVKAYAAAGLAPPSEIVWAGGPVELANSWARSRSSAGDNVRSLVIDLPCRKSEAGVDRVVGLAVRVALAGEPRLARVPAFCASIEEAVLREGERVRPLLRARLASIFAPRKRASLSFASSSFALHSAPSLGPLEFLHDVCNLARQTKALRGLWEIARNASWTWLASALKSSGAVASPSSSRTNVPDCARPLTDRRHVTVRVFRKKSSTFHEPSSLFAVRGMLGNSNARTK